MAQKIVVFDDAVKQLRATATTLSGGVGFTDQDFDIGVGGQSTFVVTTTFTSTQKMDVYANGRKMREGAGNDFTRNTGTNSVVFNFTVPQNGWVSVRVYSA